MPETLTLVDPLAALFHPALAGRPPLRLDGVAVAVTLRPARAQVVITRRFTNRNDHPIEAALTLPVCGPGERIYGLSVRVDGVLYLARPAARREADDRYGAALADGRLAILHEPLTDNLQLVSIAGIGPGAEVEVSVALTRPLEAAADGTLRLDIALTANPADHNGRLSDAERLVTDPELHDAQLTVSAQGLEARLAEAGPRLQSGVATAIACNAPIRLVITRLGDPAPDSTTLPPLPDNLITPDQSLVFVSPSGEVLDRLPLFTKVVLPHPDAGIMPGPAPPLPPPPQARPPATRWMVWGAVACAALLVLGSFHLGPVPVLPALAGFVVFMILNAIRLLPGDDPAARRRLPWLALFAIPWIIALAFGPFGPLAAQDDAGRQNLLLRVQAGALALAAALPLLLLLFMIRARRLTFVVGLLNLVLVFLLVAISTTILDPGS